MNKLMSVFLVALMAFGLFGIMMMQPIEVQAADPFKDFNVTIGQDGKVDIDSAMDEEGSTAIGTIIEKYKNFIVGISGIAAVTMVVLFILNFLKLGASAGNPNARSQAITGILWTGIAAALLGSVSLITGVFYGFMN